MRLRYNNQFGTLVTVGTDVTNSLVSPNIDFAVAPNFATIVAPDYIPLVLDAGKAGMEIVWLTAYTAGATSGTVTRAAEDATNWPAATHAAGTWACDLTAYDTTLFAPVTEPIALTKAPLAYIPALVGTAEKGGTAGGSLIQNGWNVNGTRNAAIWAICGDSIAAGGGGTLGSTTFGDYLGNLANQSNGLPSPGIGLNLCNNANSARSWTNIVNGTAPASAFLYGAACTATALQLASAGKSISDTRSFRRVKAFYQTTYNGDGVTFAVTGGSAPTATLDTHSAATGCTSAAAVVTAGALVGVAPAVGDYVTVQAGTGTIPASTTVLAVNGTAITLSVAPSVALSAATISFSGFRQWDSGDLLSVVGTVLTATWATKVTGAGGAGAYVLAARYYQTDGTKGVVIDNIAVGGTSTVQWGQSMVPAGGAANGWGIIEWLQMHVNAGTPIQRVIWIVGINDLLLNTIYTPALYSTYLNTICTTIKAVSPLTEIVLVAEYYGDVITTFANVVTTSGSPIIYSTTGTLGYNIFIPLPSVGTVMGGPGIPTGATVTTGPFGPTVGTTPTMTCSISGTALTTTGNFNTTLGVNSTVVVLTGPGISGLVTATITGATTATLSVSSGTQTSQTYTFYGCATLSANATASATITAQGSLARLGPTNWSTLWVPVVAQVALAQGAKFINLWERFGDISARGLATLTATTTASSVLTCSAGFPNAVAGMAVNGSTIPPGALVQSYTPGATTLTLNFPVTIASGQTVYYGSDTFGQCQSAQPNIHMGDYSQSWTGQDGQNALAGFVYDRLCSNPKPGITAGSDTSLIAGGTTTVPAVTNTATVLSSTSDTSFSMWVSTSATVALSYGPVTGSEKVILASTATVVKTQFIIPRVPKGWRVLALWSTGTPTFVAQIC